MLQETWLTAGPKGDSPEFDHYELISYPSSVTTNFSKPRRGLGLLVMKGYQSIVRDMQWRKSKSDNAESQWFRIVCDNVKIACINTYLPDKHNTIDTIRTAQHNLSDEIYKFGGKFPHDAFLLGGDMNVAMGERDGSLWGLHAPHIIPNDAGKSLHATMSPHKLWSHMGRDSDSMITYKSGHFKTAPDYLLSRGIRRTPATIVPVDRYTSDHFLCFIEIPATAKVGKVHSKIRNKRLN
jgi:hypothetical protein